jgi:hypothetical protein
MRNYNRSHYHAEFDPQAELTETHQICFESDLKVENL